MKKLMVKFGSFKNKDGVEKNNWVQVGSMGNNQHGDFIMLKPEINLSALTEFGKPLFVSIFEEDNNDKPKQTSEPVDSNADIDSDIPF